MTHSGYLIHWTEDGEVKEDGYLDLGDFDVVLNSLREDAERDGLLSLPMLVECVLDTDYANEPDERSGIFTRDYFAKRANGLQLLIGHLEESRRYAVKMLDEVEKRGNE